MKIYMAPLEGITGYIFRNTYDKIFGNVDAYYAPFIATKTTKKYGKKEIRDILPENSTVKNLIPQILTNNAKDFNELAAIMHDMGYNEVNLNLGCPSPTVTTKGKGAGFLEYPESLAEFLEDIFKNRVCDISVKTRIGISEPEEFRRLLSIFNRYPIKELIIHPRLLESKYNGKPNWDWYEYAYNNSQNPICYNSDINTVGDFTRIMTMFNNTKSIMIGRGILRDPILVDKIIDNPEYNYLNRKQVSDKIKQFHDELYAEYMDYMSGEMNVLFKMKEIWTYLSENELFENNERLLKRIRKAKTCSEYENIISELFL